VEPSPVAESVSPPSVPVSLGLLLLLHAAAVSAAHRTRKVDRMGSLRAACESNM
jgi:hypothetical protein